MKEEAGPKVYKKRETVHPKQEPEQVLATTKFSLTIPFSPVSHSLLLPDLPLLYLVLYLLIYRTTCTTCCVSLLHCFPLFLPLLPVHVPCIPGCYACLPSSSSPSLSRPSSSVILNLFPLLFLSCFSGQLLHVYLRQDNCLHWTCCWFCWFLQSFHFVCHHISWAVIFIEEGFLACPSRPYSSSSWFFLLILNQWLRKSNESWLLYGHLDWRQPVDCVSLVAAIYSRRTRLNFFSALLFFLLSAL